MDVPLDPVLRPRLFVEKRFVQHRVPLEVRIHLEAVAVCDGGHPRGVLHLLKLVRHASALVQVRVKDLHTLFYKPPDEVPALGILVALPRVQALSAPV